ncbi:MAG TPA: acetyltransferase [Candidatus Dormibacteraeota bacterium]|nr:acetyltransferase [Candidatus Dormibacteraeota bacterium]
MASKRKKLLIWGAGGHAKVVADLVDVLGSHEIVAFFDDVANPGRGRKLLAVRVVTEREEFKRLISGTPTEVIVAIGNCEARTGLANEARVMGLQLAPALVHPRATVASGVTLGAGSVVLAGAVVNTGTTIGENVIVNTSSSVDHDCVLKDGVHICPGAHLAGDVTVDRGAWVGIGATVIEKVRIGERALIAAGAVVVRDVPAGAVAKGCPGKISRGKKAPRRYV